MICKLYKLIGNYIHVEENSFQELLMPFLLWTRNKMKLSEVMSQEKIFLRTTVTISWQEFDPGGVRMNTRQVA